MALYVQYGCGFCAPKEWQNYDASLTLRAERIPVFGSFIKKNVSRFPPNVLSGDIVRGLPVPDGMADAVYASHVLEHLSREDFGLALRNTWRILTPGGVFRLIVPDLEARARSYLKRLEAGQASANDWFMSVSSLGMEKKPAGFISLFASIFGASHHLWMWDWPSMKAALDMAGFTSIRRCERRDSGDPMFNLVEEASRFYDDNQHIRELAVHCVKPPA